jgi:hypothetical protein
MMLAFNFSLAVANSEDNKMNRCGMYISKMRGLSNIIMQAFRNFNLLLYWNDALLLTDPIDQLVSTYSSLLQIITTLKNSIKPAASEVLSMRLDLSFRQKVLYKGDPFLAELKVFRYSFVDIAASEAEILAYHCVAERIDLLHITAWEVFDIENGAVLRTARTSECVGADLRRGSL